MSEIFENIYVELDEDLDTLVESLVPGASGYHVLRQAIDARRRQQRPRFVYRLEIFSADEIPRVQKLEPLERISWKQQPPIIVGAGPAGLFAALRLVERGIPCRLLERGSSAEKRILKINRFWRYGELDLDNNVCFGEGGAGLYSDGKLITRIKSPHIPYVLQKLVNFGAPEEILYLANPHVGSDRIRRLIPIIRKYLLEKGCEIHYESSLEELLIEGSTVRGVRLKDGREFTADHVVLATVHSAGDLFQKLRDQGIAMQGKSFAVGFRIEHPQKLINQIQYRDWESHPKLPTANYRLAEHNKTTNLGVYSFCMCPGGYIISSGTSENQVVSNGMSNYRRNSPFANAAIVITVDHEKRFASHGDFAGMDFRDELEQRAYGLVKSEGGQHQLPAQRVLDFLNHRKSSKLLPTSCPSGAISAPLHQLLPKDLQTQLEESLLSFEKTMPGFCGEEAQLFAMESRTSCPLRLSRDPLHLQSLNHQGLYPCGEGAGYAGGITSAAVDGVRVAEAITRTQ
jgi:uncharacterized FAD-dependent dehydrogenase